MKLAEDGTTKVAENAEDEATLAEEQRLADEAAAAAGDDKGAGDADPDAPPKGEEADPDADPDEVVVAFGSEASPAPEDDDSKAPEWVRELRKTHREALRKNRELEDQVKALSGAPVKEAELGPKPKLEDFDYKPDEFATALEAWHDKKRAADAEAAKKQEAEAADKAAWTAKLEAYATEKKAVKVKDFEDAEAIAKDVFSVTQQGVILQGADKPALLVYALGKNPKKAKELAAIKDPVKFAFAVAKLETQLKVTPRKAPPPEEKPQGGVPKAGAVDSHLERLRADAAKTGDFSKVTAYRREQRNKKAA